MEDRGPRGEKIDDALTQGIRASELYGIKIGASINGDEQLLVLSYLSPTAYQRFEGFISYRDLVRVK